MLAQSLIIIVDTRMYCRLTEVNSFMNGIKLILELKLKLLLLISINSPFSIIINFP